MDSASLSKRSRDDRWVGHPSGITAPAIVIHPSDNVATALSLIPADRPATFRKSGKAHRIMVQEEIPMGHKLSLCRIRKGEMILKYGEPIGLATIDIGAGYHVHTHNVESQRVRGDLAPKRGA